MTQGTYVVGLTGGIGSGKTAVADAFAALGVEIIDTDALAHALSAVGQPGFAAIRDAFCEESCGPTARSIAARCDGSFSPMPPRDRGWKTHCTR